MEEVILSLLDQAIKIGLDERDFWEMTIAEVGRWSEGVAHRKNQSNKEVANMMWLLPQLISSAIGSLFDKNATYPRIEEVFPDLFENDPEVEKRKKMERSAINIIQFANSPKQHFKRDVIQNE